MRVKIFYLGIDIGKSFHIASLIDDKKDVISKSFQFKNTTDDANLLFEKIALYPEIEIDSIIIADLIRYGKYSETSLRLEEILEIRNLSRFRISLVDSIGDLKRKIICVLDQLFPEYDNKLSNLAKNSFGISFGLQLLISQISFIEGQFADVEQKISELLDKLNSFITTISVVGKVVGATISGEIGDITRFSSPAKLVAYACFDSKIELSGISQDFCGKMTKRGSPFLSTALFRAALVASNTDPVFQAFYQKKHAEGKHHLTFIGAVARKLCYTVHAILIKKNGFRKIISAW